jgi:uncharacterized protein YqhQ
MAKYMYIYIYIYMTEREDHSVMKAALSIGAHSAPEVHWQIIPIVKGFAASLLRSLPSGIKDFNYIKYYYSD